MAKETSALRPGANVRELRKRLRDAEQALMAIRAREVDAVMSSGGERAITLAGSQLAYHILFDEMNEGAVTLTRDGIVAYCNRRLAEILRAPADHVIGQRLTRFVARGEIGVFEGLRLSGLRGNARSDLTFRAADGTPIPVAMSFAPLHVSPATTPIGVVGVIRDNTDRKVAENERRRLTDLLITAQEEERRRLARELHDEIGQSLTAVLVGLAAIEGAKTVERSGQLAHGLRETTARTLADVGRMWRGLHPAVLDDSGLTEAIRHHAEDFEKSHGLKVRTELKGLETEPLSLPVRATVYRVVQEALSNVAQHAAASRVHIRVRRSGLTLLVFVEDNGRGFVFHEKGRLGLRGMRERAALLGGSIDVRSRIGHGTKLIAQFPVA